MSRCHTRPRLFVALATLAIASGCGDDTGSGGGDPGAGSIQVQVSGEDLAVDGFRFPQGSEVTISDG